MCFDASDDITSTETNSTDESSKTLASFSCCAGHIIRNYVFLYLDLVDWVALEMISLIQGLSQMFQPYPLNLSYSVHLSKYAAVFYNFQILLYGY